MSFEPVALGNTIRARRLSLPLTQAELAERLNVTAQAVSLWERGETTPDISLLPDLSRILNCPVDTLLGSPLSAVRRRITVQDMREVIGCILRLRELLGQEHFIYRTMADALDMRMNSRIEAALASDDAMDAYVCEALLECVAQGDWADLTDVKRNIRNEKASACTLARLQTLGMK